MKFAFSPEQEAWRGEVRDFLSRHHPRRFFLNEFSEEAWEYRLAFQRKVAERGWIGLSWPEEYGGQGRSLVDQLIYAEEMGFAHAPDPGGIGARFVAPTIMHWGTDDQKRFHLTLIRDGQVTWCQGFSEPGSGSDLASLQTRARRDGDHFVISGEKIWTSFADRAQWCLLAARTDPEAPKHKGITLFLLPMDAPGIEVSPVYDIASQRALNQVRLDDVAVGADSVLGEIDRGWYVATTTLDFERSNALAIARTRRDIYELCRDEGLQRPRNRVALADIAVGGEVARLLSHLVISLQIRGTVPNREASAAKLFWSELAQRVLAFAVSAKGLHGQLFTDENPSARLHLSSLAYTIAGGTSEIQRNIIALRGLGLPR